MQESGPNTGRKANMELNIEANFKTHVEAVKQAFGRLYEIIKQLRAPGGCAWDREQTPYSIRTNLVEEAYECVSAIEEGDDEDLKEELGDIFLVAGMMAGMKEEDGSFYLSEVLEDINAKLVRRHPHVFGDATKETPDEVLEQWDHIKDHVEGKKPRKSVLERIPRTLPPLERSYMIQEKVSKVGFDWEDTAPVWEKLEEEIRELKEASKNGDLRHIESEFGDILFTIVNLGRLMHIDPTLALNGTNQKFITRFQEVEKRLKENGLTAKEAGLDRMDRLWNEIKKEK